ncbi:hypothetical protein CU034_1659 [Enterococcus faecium]|nr:hypothetical protein [Enterococcus faecium]
MILFSIHSRWYNQLTKKLDQLLLKSFFSIKKLLSITPTSLFYQISNVILLIFRIFSSIFQIF